jgi:hypothetical protein
MEHDPKELKNLWNDKKYATVKTERLQCLMDWLWSRVIKKILAHGEEKHCL